MSSSFTPSNTIDMSKERDWPVSLGMLDWDDTKIVFTKRSLIEFLKYTGITVDTNFYNISKLPRYAQFGKLTEPSVAQGDGETGAQAASDPSGELQSDFKPTRRVREAPGGTHTDIFAHADDDALSAAPPKGGQIKDTNQSAAPKGNSQDDTTEQHEGLDFGNSFKPTRRVRENPGGTSSLSNFWDAEDQESFKPTRRVRERPGGKDSISGIF